MKVFHSEKHRLRDAGTELSGGLLVAPFECPARVAHIREELARRGYRDLAEPEDRGMEPILRVHDADYVGFLQSAWEEWAAAGYAGDAIPTVFPSRRMTRNRPPRDIDGRLGYYCLASETSISPGTWDAAYWAAQTALAGAAAVSGGAGAAFALCRPPGHHAAQDMYGGYCFLNNAAVAAQALRDAGAARVTVLDVDFHHGNGTQAIFWDRADVQFLSLHGDPEDAFPHYLGGEDETGEGAGAGFTRNWALPVGCTAARWFAALEDALEEGAAFAPDALVVSLGVDTFARDPISFFTLEADDFTAMGTRLAGAGLPTLFVMEGGYAVAEIGVNTVNVLDGFGRG